MTGHNMVVSASPYHLAKLHDRHGNFTCLARPCGRAFELSTRRSAVRLPILDPKELSDEQKPLYTDMQAGIKDHFKGFVNMRDDGALLGPWNPWIREPRFGGPV